MSYFNIHLLPLSVFSRTFLMSLMLMTSMGSFAQEFSVENESVDYQIEQVRINEADAETIARSLEGIGMTRAAAIVDFREEYGDFTTLEDLQLVKGVGEVTLKNNETRIRFD